MAYKQMRDELSCPICMELYRQPRRLPCGHAYCHQCIEALVRTAAEQHPFTFSLSSRSMTCPECRESVRLDYVLGIEALPLDFKLSRLVELLKFMKSNSSSSDEDDFLGQGATSLRSRVRSNPPSPDPTPLPSTPPPSTLSPAADLSPLSPSAAISITAARPVSPSLYAPDTDSFLIDPSTSPTDDEIPLWEIIVENLLLANENIAFFLLSEDGINPNFQEYIEMLLRMGSNAEANTTITACLGIHEHPFTSFTGLPSPEELANAWSTVRVLAAEANPFVVAAANRNDDDSHLGAAGNGRLAASLRDLTAGMEAVAAADAGDASGADGKAVTEETRWRLDDGVADGSSSHRATPPDVATGNNELLDFSVNHFGSSRDLSDRPADRCERELSDADADSDCETGAKRTPSWKDSTQDPPKCKKVKKKKKVYPYIDRTTRYEKIKKKFSEFFRGDSYTSGSDSSLLVDEEAEAMTAEERHQHVMSGAKTRVEAARESRMKKKSQLTIKMFKALVLSEYHTTTSSTPSSDSDDERFLWSDEWEKGEEEEMEKNAIGYSETNKGSEATRVNNVGSLTPAAQQGRDNVNFVEEAPWLDSWTTDETHHPNGRQEIGFDTYRRQNFPLPQIPPLVSGYDNVEESIPSPSNHSPAPDFSMGASEFGPDEQRSGGATETASPFAQRGATLDDNIHPASDSAGIASSPTAVTGRTIRTGATASRRHLPSLGDDGVTSYDNLHVQDIADVRQNVSSTVSSHRLPLASRNQSSPHPWHEIDDLKTEVATGDRLAVSGHAHSVPEDCLRTTRESNEGQMGETGGRSRSETGHQRGLGHRIESLKEGGGGAVFEVESPADFNCNGAARLRDYQEERVVDIEDGARPVHGNGTHSIHQPRAGLTGCRQEQVAGAGHGTRAVDAPVAEPAHHTCTQPASRRRGNSTGSCSSPCSKPKCLASLYDNVTVEDGVRDDSLGVSRIRNDENGMTATGSVPNGGKTPLSSSSTAAARGSNSETTVEDTAHDVNNNGSNAASSEWMACAETRTGANTRNGADTRNGRSGHDDSDDADVEDDDESFQPKMKTSKKPRSRFRKFISSLMRKSSSSSSSLDETGPEENF